MFQGFVGVSPALQEVVSILLTLLFSYLLLQLAAAVPWLAEYLGQYKVGIVTWLVGLIVQLLNAQLQKIPATWDEVVALVMQLIVAVVTVLLAFAGWRKVKGLGAKAL